MAPAGLETRFTMVLGISRPTHDEATADTRTHDDLYPATFTEHLDHLRRTWNDKVLFQQKQRRQWQRHTGADIYRDAHNLAAGLVARGLQPGERVLLVMENGYDWVRAYYAIVLTGAVAVPIYFDLKPHEIAAMSRHADPAMAILSPKPYSRLREHLAQLRALIVAGEPGEDTHGAPSLDEIAGEASEDARRTLASRTVRPDDLASIVFTSGTSGGAKGVMLTHRNFMVNNRQMRACIPFNERDRVVIVLPMHHAFPFLVAVVIAPVAGAEITFENDLRRIRDRMAEVKPTIFLGVPALFEVMYRNILHSIEVQGRMETFEKGLRIVEATKKRTGINIGRIVFRELHKRLGGSLRFMVSGGAALNPQVALDFSRLGIAIIQGWGLSEASPGLSIQRWSPRKFYMSNYYEERLGSIGPAIEGVEVALIDVPEKELYVNIHGEGELIARGDNITPGYWRAPEESAAIKMGDWLRTGDVGRIDDEGNIWITGRSKFVIVLDSGEKVHPDELEECIERSRLVQDVLVFGRKVRGKTQVTALIYPNRDEAVALLGGGDPTHDAVAELVDRDLAVQQRDLAQYKRVAEFILTDEPLPRTPIRKVMRGAVRDAYSFDTERWAASWQALQDALATPEPEPEEPATA